QKNLAKVLKGLNLSAEEKKQLKSGVMDLKLGDLLKFYTTSATLITDPFITSVYEKYLTNMLIAQSQSEVDKNEMVANILRVREKLSKAYNLNSYKVDKLLYRSENFTSNIKGTL